MVPPLVFAPVRWLIAAAGVLAVLPASSARAADCTPAAGWGTNRASLATEVVQLVNQHRAGLGLTPLAVSPTLTAAAEWKSLNMAGGGPVTHDDPTRLWYQRIRDCGYPATAVGENIAAGQAGAQEVMADWLASSGHRLNIENARYAAIGVGAAANAGGRLFWTQDFGSVVDAVAAPPPPPAGATRPAQAAPPPTARCRRMSRRRIRCRVAKVGEGTVMRARLERRGRIRAVSRRAVPVRAGAAALTFRTPRVLRAGRYVLVLPLRGGPTIRVAVRLPATGRRAVRGRTASVSG
jgi:uncharacterized protein YkwD